MTLLQVAVMLTFVAGHADDDGAASSSSSSGKGKSEKQLLLESLNTTIKQLLLALGLNKIATGNWEAIIKKGGTTDTGRLIPTAVFR